MLEAEDWLKSGNCPTDKVYETALTAFGDEDVASSVLSSRLASAMRKRGD